MSDSKVGASHYANQATTIGATAKNWGDGGPDVAQLMIATEMDQCSTVDDQVADQMKGMRARSDWLKQANKALETLMTNRPSVSDTGLSDYGTLTMADGTTMAMTSWCDANGVAIEHGGTDNSGNQHGFDDVIQAVKDGIDAANNQSQMDQVRLQGLMDKHNNYYQQLSNTISSNNDVIKAILQKMGQ